MAFATADFTTVPAEHSAVEVKEVKKQGFFSRLFNAMVEARMREAERRVAAQLASFDDRTLAALGYERSDLVAKNNGLR